MQNVLDQFDQDTAERAQSESAQQGRQIREIEFDKGRDQDRDREFDQLQDPGDCGQNTCYGDISRARCF